MSSLISRFWWVWIFVLALTFFIQASTLDVLPSLQKDEMQITDYGRLTLDPRSDWGVTWLVTEGKPILLWSYLGPLMAEISYQVGGPSGLGPRIFALLGGLFAATMALGWLLARRVPLYAAACLSLAFLLDPLFVLSQRMARVDSWVLALCLASCWLLRASGSKQGSSIWIRVMGAGALAAAAAFIWPSAIFLYPLMLVEFFQLVRATTVNGSIWSPFALQGIRFIGGGLFASVVLLIPIWQNLSIIFSDLSNVVSKNVEASRSLPDRLSSIFSYHLWAKLVKAFVKTLSFFLPLAALFGACYRRDKGLIAASLSVVILIFATLVYELRVLYLLPYLLILCGGIYQQFADRPPGKLAFKIGRIALFILVIWSAGTSLLLRSALGFTGKAERNRDQIVHAATTSIGVGNYRVFLGFTYEFYYAGRSLGWKLYTPYGQQDYDSQGNWIDRGYKPKDKFYKLFSEMDYAIFHNGAITTELAEELAKSGLQYEKTITVSALNSGGQNEVQNYNWVKENLLFYLRGQERYGPYLIYARRNSQIAAVEIH